jgi:hypothetical protein
MFVSALMATLLDRAGEVIKRSGQLFEPGLIDNPQRSRLRVINVVSIASHALPLLPRFRTYRCVAPLGDQIG